MNSIKKERKYTIGQVSKKYKLPITSIRYYEKKGLLTPEGTDEQGNRLFSESNLKRVLAIKTLRSAKIGITEIKDLFEVAKGDKTSLEEKKEILKNKRDEINFQIDNLNTIIEYLEYKDWYYSEAIKLGVDELEANLDQIVPDKHKDILDFIIELRKEYS